MLDPMGGVNPNEPIDDVPAGEVAKLVQNNTAYYLPVFMNYKRNRRNRFNFCAFSAREDGSFTVSNINGAPY